MSDSIHDRPVPAQPWKGQPGELTSGHTAPQRVVITDIDVRFTTWFELVFKVTMASLLVGFFLAIVGAVLWALFQAATATAG
jgi:hypothetical protein